MTGKRLLGTAIALSLLPAAVVYAAAVPLLVLVFALGSASPIMIIMMGVAGTMALLCVVLAIQILIRPRRVMVAIGAILTLVALLLFLQLKKA